MEGAHDRGGGGLEGQHPDVGCDGLVDVQNVEVSGLQPTPGPPGHERAEVQPRHRAVIGDGNGVPGTGDPVGQDCTRGGRCENLNLVAAPEKLAGKVHDVRLNASMRVEGVGADKTDPHDKTSSSRSRT